MTTRTFETSSPRAARAYPRIVGPLPGPKAREIKERHDRYASTSYPKEYPLAIARGAGPMVEDVDGNRFLDFMAGIATAATGHAHPRVVEAIQEQASRFLHICGSDFYFDGFSALVERLARLAPGQSAKRVFLSNSGTEAVEGAIKLVRNSTRRPALIAFIGAFHGRTYGSMSLTASKARHRAGMGPFLPEVHHVPYPNPYRDGADALARTMAAFDELFTRRLDPRDVAGIFVEPVQGEGGYVVPPAGFLRSLREMCDRHGILLVCDEVQSGIGRTGRMFACEHDGIEPDVITVGKGIASGMPLGAVIAKQSVMKWEPGAHGSTFGGNPVSCAAALATLDLVEQGLMRNAESVGATLSARMRELGTRHPSIGDVRGRGLMLGVELVKDRATREPAPELIEQLVDRAFHKGLLVLGCGKSTLRLAPPLLIDEQDVDIATGIIDEVLGEIEGSSS